MPDTSTWVLDLSSNPPDIYNSEGAGSVHNALQAPFPNCFWYVNSEGNDIVNPSYTNSHSPALGMPFPSCLWYVNEEGNDVTNSSYIESHSPAVGTPLPYVFWFVNSTGDDVIHEALKEVEYLGAFHKSKVNNIKIPIAVKNIGDRAFDSTPLRRVTIAEDCTYYPTSFPSECEVTFYEEV